MEMQKYWSVNRKQTFKHEIEGGFLWSPKLKSEGNRNYFYDTMANAEVGDIVLIYANGILLAYLGIVPLKKHARVRKPDQFAAAGDFLGYCWLVSVHSRGKRSPPAVKPNSRILYVIGHCFPAKI